MSRECGLKKEASPFFLWCQMQYDVTSQLDSILNKKIKKTNMMRGWQVFIIIITANLEYGFCPLYLAYYKRTLSQ